MPTRAPPNRKHLDWLEFEGEVTESVSNARIDEVVIWCAETRADISHWRTSFLFPATPDKFHGISFDMTLPILHKHNKERRNSLGSLKVTIFNTSSSPVTTHPRIRFPAPFLVSNVTVSSLLREIQNRGFQFYRFNECGSGCLLWNMELLKMLVEFQWVNSRSQRKFEDEIEDWRSGEGRRQKGKIPMPPCKGEFIGRSLFRVTFPTRAVERSGYSQLRQQEGSSVPDPNRRRVLSAPGRSQLPTNEGHRTDQSRDQIPRDLQTRSARRHSR